MWNKSWNVLGICQNKQWNVQFVKISPAEPDFCLLAVAHFLSEKLL